MIKIFSRNDVLECISNNKGICALTIGKEYKCLSCSSCTESVIITDDNNIKKSYPTQLFKKK